MFHYFVKRAGKAPLIIGFSEKVDVSLNPSFQRFTEEQEQFYANHPDLQGWDVMNMHEPETIPEPVPEPLEDVKERAKENLSQKSLDTLGKHVQVYKFANAISSILKKDDEIYSVADAEAIIDEYNHIGKKLRAMYKEAEALIEAATTHQEVAEIETTYNDKYDKYSINNNEAE